MFQDLHLSKDTDIRILIDPRQAKVCFENIVAVLLQET